MSWINITKLDGVRQVKILNYYVHACLGFGKAVHCTQYNFSTTFGHIFIQSSNLKKLTS